MDHEADHPPTLRLVSNADQSAGEDVWMVRDERSDEEREAESLVERTTPVVALSIAIGKALAKDYEGSRTWTEIARVRNELTNNR